jgi:hypothetical protein
MHVIAEAVEVEPALALSGNYREEKGKCKG